MEIHLNEGETWMLRYVGVHHETTKLCIVDRNHWPPPEGTWSCGKGMPQTSDEAWCCVRGLDKRDLISAVWDSSDVTVVITGAGLDYLWELDHPDLVARVRDWSRRSPCAAYAIIAVLTIGAAASFLGIVWSAGVAAWTWLFPG